jgi:hypothetical protein
MAAIVTGVLTLFVLRIGLFGSVTAGFDPTLTAIIVAAAAYATLAMTTGDHRDTGLESR